MSFTEKEIQAGKCIHYALQLPVCLSENGIPVHSFPDKYDTAASVTGNQALLPSPTDETGTVQYILSPAGDRYIIYAFSSALAMVIGPFLTEKVPEGRIGQLVSEGQIRMHLRSAVRTYLDSLPVLSVQQYYYTGRLVEFLLSSQTELKNNPGSWDLSQAFIPNSYYQKAQDYRTMQFLHSPYMTEQEICHYISKGDSVSALHILAEINEHPRAQLAGTALRSLKNSIICSCAFMARAAISGGVRPDDAFTLSDAYIQQIETCSDINIILHFEEQMVIGYTSAVNSLRKGKYSSTVASAFEYIDAHLCEKLTVANIAQSVFLNPNYLSGLFRRETGETIHSYILRKRVEAASFFVRNSTESFADIASFYQFSSQSHFVHSFRQIMGITPGECRRTSRQSSENNP